MRDQALVSTAILLTASVCAHGTGGRPPHVPLLFEPNQGQAPHAVQYLAHARGYDALLTPNGITLAIVRADRQVTPSSPQPRTVQLRWLGASSGGVFRPEGRLASHSNYFLGRDPSEWHIQVPHFSSVLEQAVVPGIDVRLRASRDGNLEYDLLLAPSADLQALGIEVRGADSVRVHDDGSLIIQAGGESIVQPPAVAYEVLNDRRHSVEIRYVVENEKLVRFRARQRTPGSRLVIDPYVTYGTYLGGSTTAGDPYSVPGSAGYGVAVDDSGFVYVTGNTNTIDFPTTAGSYEPECPGPGSQAGCASRSVAFVAKFTPSGALRYATYLSGMYGVSDSSAGKIIAADGSGNVYVTGGAFGGFPVTSQAFQQDCAFETDSTCAFLSKLSPDGSKLLYSTYFGNGFPMTQYTMGFGLALGKSGNVYIAGWTESPDLPTTSGAFQQECPNPFLGGCFAGFVARFNTTLSGRASLVYATYMGAPDDTGEAASEVDGIAVDGTGNAYVTGMTNSAAFPHSAAFGTGAGPGPASGFLQIVGPTFVAKLSPGGKQLLYSTLLRGATGRSIAVDSANHAYVTGSANGGLRVTEGVAQGTFGGGTSDAFVTKLSAAGNALQYSTFVGGLGADDASAIVVNAYGMAFITGSTQSSNFPLLASWQKKTNSGQAAFVTGLQPNAKAFYYSVYLGGSKYTVGASIATDRSWNAYIVGSTTDKDLRVTGDAFQSTRNGNQDAFLTRLTISLNSWLNVSTDISTVSPNGVVNFRYRLVNGGADGTVFATIENPIPPGWKYAGVYSPNATRCSGPAYGATTGNVTCTLAQLDKWKALYMNVYLRANAASGTTLRNAATSWSAVPESFTRDNVTETFIQVQ